MRSRLILYCIGGMAAWTSAEEGVSYRIRGGAWFDLGRIIQASDTLLASDKPGALDLNGNVIYSPGGQFTLEGELGEHWSAALGFGSVKATHALGKGSNSYNAISLYQNFITQSRLTFHTGDREKPTFSATLGAFPYKYNPDAHNLGLHLFRGSVYPGILMGGFDDPSTDTTRSTLLGWRLHHSMGIFSHDLILNNERELPPTFDWSLGYVAKLKMGAFTLGAGMNFYRLLAYSEEHTMEPGRLATLGKGRYIDDTTSTDTLYLSHRGIKAMGMFSLDIKTLLGIEAGSPDDFRLYGEADVIGIQNQGKTYNDIARRIPMMLGFNIPTFGILDKFSIEVEHYRSPYRNDLARVGNNNVVADWTAQTHPIPSAKPVSYEDYGMQKLPDGRVVLPSLDTINVSGTVYDRENLTTDDLKWSINLQKSVGSHIRFIAQIANDHYRPRPVATGLIFSNGGTAEAFSKPSDMYVMLRMGYFF